MSRRALWRLAALAGATALATFLWLRPGDRGSSEQAPAAVEAQEVSTPGPAPRATADPLPLPPDNAPLDRKLEALQSHADAGDRKAACRLGMELLACEWALSWEDTLAFNERRSGPGQAPSGNPIDDDALDLHRVAGLETVIACRAVPEALRSAGARYLVQAARAGEPEAMLRYAIGQHLPPTGRGSFVDPEFDAWRRDAPGMLWRALEAGQAGAVVHLQFAYLPGHDLLGVLMGDDALKSHAFKLLAQMLFGSSPPIVQEPLDAEGQLRAREMAEDWHKRFFGGRRHVGQNPLPPLHGRTAGSPDFCR